MKKIYLLLVSFGLFITSCEKDDDTGDPSKSNSFTYKGVEYTIDKCDLTYWGISNDVYELSFDLYSNDYEQLGFDNEENRLGNGFKIYIDLYTNSSTEVSDGTYNYGSQESAGVFYNGEFNIFKDGVASVADDNEIESGKVVVTKNGDSYNVTFEGVDNTGATISGNYEGTPTYKDESN